MVTAKMTYREATGAATELRPAVKLGLYPIVILEKTGTEYDRKPGITWLGGTET
jgi:hypothetical protein